MKSQKFQEWLHPALSVRECADGGKGVFTDSCLEEGALLTVMGGHVMPITQEPEFENGLHDLALQIHWGFVIGSKDESEIGPADFFNHSCEPNAGFQGQVVMVALRDIAAGEQICFDYAMAVSVPDYRFVCHCGSGKCRRMVTGNDWMLPELQKRYAGYFQWYLEKHMRDGGSSPYDGCHAGLGGRDG